jgi:hypothetical protein
MIFADVIIFDGDGDAISFNDEGSPDSRQTGRTKVHINAQVNRSLSLDWFYRLLAFFPDIRTELKSGIIVARFKDLPIETRDRIWRSLYRVRIHIVDPRPHYRRANDMLRNLLKNDDAPERLRQGVAEGSPVAQYLLAAQREMVADSILRRSAAVRVQSLAHALSDLLFVPLSDELSPFFGSNRDPSPLITLEDFGRPSDPNVVRNVASWSAKASAAFHSAHDAAWEETGQDATYDRFDFGHAARRRMAQELLPSHAFDKGNGPHIELLEQTRQSMIDEVTANDQFYAVIGRPTGFVEVESNQSYYVQAADFAAGIASDIFATHKLVGVVERFEYVSFNGIRVSRADAEEEMRDAEQHQF